MDEIDTKQSRQIEGVKAQLRHLHRRVRRMEALGLALIMFVAVYVAVLLGGGL